MNQRLTNFDERWQLYTHYMAPKVFDYLLSVNAHICLYF